MKIIIILLILALLIGFIWFLYVCISTKNRIVREFKHCNVIVFGKKGNGKDVLFQKVIDTRKDTYFANLDYGGDFNIVSLKDISVSPNTYDDFINGKITKIDKNELMENKDIYISDGGIYLPSQYDTKLYKTYPSFPIFYALSRHLYNNNVHVNTQNLSRVWKALREQADYYIKCRGVLNLGFGLLVKTTEYEKYESALNGVEPIKALLFNKINKADIQQYVAKNGFIKKGFIFIFKKHIKYDTRAFSKIIFKDTENFTNENKA